MDSKVAGLQKQISEQQQQINLLNKNAEKRDENCHVNLS